MRLPFGSLCCALLFAAVASDASAQVTGPAVKKDTVKKPEMELRTIRMTPIAVLGNVMDNAGIDSLQQFPGVKDVPKSFYNAKESHLSHIRQLTFSGVNTQPRVSADDKSIVFEAHGLYPDRCDQTFVMNLSGTQVKRISAGYGRTESADFLPTGNLLYASTQAWFAGGCPPAGDSTTLGLWPLYGQYDLFIGDTAHTNGSRVTNNENFYDAEASVSAKGKILFTSTRAGDPDLFVTDASGENATQLTHDEGYDGQGVFSPNEKQIAYVVSRTTNLAQYRDLLKKGYLNLASSEIVVMDADGSHKIQLTHNGAINSAPSWHPDGKYIVFSSNAADPRSGNFDLYMVKADGRHEPERLTLGNGVNFYPAFTHDGKHLIYSSSRGSVVPNGMNIFLADWSD